MPREAPQSMDSRFRGNDEVWLTVLSKQKMEVVWQFILIDR